MSTNESAIKNSTIIYLHGFMSSGDSDKSRALKKTFGSDNVIAPDLPLDPLEVVKLVSRLVRTAKHYPVIFVGTSLGGFYANYFAQKYDCPGILVNPATSPSKTLYTAVGPNKNYKTGKTVEFKQSYLDTLASMEKEVSTIHSGGLVNLFVAKDDAVISADETLRKYPYTVHTSVYDTGGHRFEENWSDVVDRVQSILG